MERKYKDLLLTEVNRMKEIMGLKILNEAYTSVIDEILKKLFGISDEAAQKSASGAESVLKQFVGGTGSYDDIADYVARQTGGVKSIDNVVDFIKGQPEIMDSLVRNSDQIMKKAADEIFSKLNLESILTRDSYEDIESLMALTINKNNKNSVISFIDNAIDQLTPKRGSNPNIDELIKKLEDRKKLAQGFDLKPIGSAGKETAAKAATSDSANEAFDNIFRNNDLGNITDTNSGLEFLNRKLTEFETAGLINLGKTDRGVLLKQLTEQLGDALDNIDKFEKDFNRLGVEEKVGAFNKIKTELDKLAENAKNPEMKKNLNKANNWFTRNWQSLAKKKQSPIKIIKGWLWFGVFAGAYECMVKPGYQAWSTGEAPEMPNIYKCIGAVALGPISVLALLFRDGGAAILDGLDVGQYSNDAEGWADWVNDNKTNLNIVDFGYDTDEQKRYITNSAEDLIFVNYDPKSETFVPED